MSLSRYQYSFLPITPRKQIYIMHMSCGVTWFGTSFQKYIEWCHFHTIRAFSVFTTFFKNLDVRITVVIDEIFLLEIHCTRYTIWTYWYHAYCITYNRCLNRINDHIFTLKLSAVYTQRIISHALVPCKEQFSLFYCSIIRNCGKILDLQMEFLMWFIIIPLIYSSDIKKCLELLD